MDSTAPMNKDTDYLPYAEAQQWWTSSPDGEHKLQEAKTGAASYERAPLLTIPQLFSEAVKVNGGRTAMATENAPPLAKGEKPGPALDLSKWKKWTWAHYERDVRRFAKACIAVGLAQHQSVNIFGFNAPEWGIALYGAMFAGGKGAGIYPSDTKDSVKFKSDHSDGVVAAVQGKAELAKFAAVIDELPSLKAIVCWECEGGEDLTTKDGRTIKTFSFEEFLAFGDAQPDEELEKAMEKIKPGHACVLVYTSGTTGRPKAVMLSHDTLHYSSSTVLKEPNVMGLKKSAEEKMISYLPLSHVAGMMVDLVAPLCLSANLNFKGNMATYFARSYDLKRGSLVDRLKAVKPTIFLGVPRVWEKIMEKLLQVGASAGSITKAISGYAKKRGNIYTSTRQLGGSQKKPKSMMVANLILKKIKTKLGLNQCKFMFSGAAPLSMEVLEYFGSLGININEVYGMSETAGVGTWSTDNHHVWGSVGYETSGAEVKVLDKATMKEMPHSKDLFHPTEEEQGEICFRGRNIMMGYMANPRLGDEHIAEINEKNASCIDEHGWVHSGDKGTKDSRGMYKITGRYKELIIGAGGENIAPVPIEDELKKLCHGISNAMMVGNMRKFNVVLITLKTVGATGEFPGSDKLDGLALKLGKSKTVSEAMDDEDVIKSIQEAIEKTNANKDAVPSNAAKIQKFTILPRDFSVQTGELTATLKLKRSVAEDVFTPIIDKMYEIDGTYINYNEAPTVDLNMGTVQEQEPVERGMSFKLAKEVEEADEILNKEEDKAV